MLYRDIYLDFCLKRQLLEEREEYISKLQVELVEKYQDTLITEKQQQVAKRTGK